MVGVKPDILEICSRQTQQACQLQHSKLQVVTLDVYECTCLPLCFPPARIHFCELTARVSLPSADDESAVPRKIDLYWFIPAFTKSRVAAGDHRDITQVRSSYRGQACPGTRERRRWASSLSSPSSIVSELLD